MENNLTVDYVNTHNNMLVTDASSCTTSNMHYWPSTTTIGTYIPRQRVKLELEMPNIPTLSLRDLGTLLAFIQKELNWEVKGIKYSA